MSYATRCLTLCCLSTLLAAARAADNAAVSDPALADADFAVQGEYQGEFTSAEGSKKLGVQVIALGAGKFHAKFCFGGLPGDGWDKSATKQADGETKDGETKFTSAEGSATIKNCIMTVSHTGGQQVAELKKIQRKSSTLGAKPPAGAIVLFDGTSVDAFPGGKRTDDGLLASGVTSKQKFQDFSLHLEFRTPYQASARGQGRGNSGCYLQGRYEVQILDSFGLEGKNNECGGIYETRDPDLNMCYPPLAWQTYDIDYTAARYDAAGNKTANARATVRHNGVVVHNDVELPKATRASPVKEGPEPGPIYLQDHGNPVRLRNIWLVEKK